MASKRTYTSIVSRAYILNLRADSHFWSDEEMNIIKANYQQGINKLMELLPQRTKASIKNTLKKLKLFVKIPNWSDEEIEIVKQYYSLEGKNGVSKRLNRTPTACELKAHQLGLIHRPMVRRTPELIDILKQHYSLEGPQKILQRLPNTFTKSAVQTKAYELGLTKKISSKWTQEEINILKQYFPTEGSEGILKRLPKHNKASISCKAYKLGLKIKNKTFILGKKVKCLETGEIFESIAQANKKYPGAESLKLVIEGKRSYAGKLPDGTKLHWEYVDDSQN